ncbi:autophagy protein 16 [Lepidopterella palustris CBS 459.81]|uniref:Autophagy protein 16 n=1 Tax=Lepidopterella palustris CBS 459.81 TaxID=1314670 RepID=A0A8E2JCH9_9PEZI|nr:autophagy protein 16 [Lepidopterella palustris CBS 459.81]
MTSWLAQYSSALDVRDAREQAHSVYIYAYTKLADRTATLTNPTAPTPLPDPLAKPAARPSTPRGKPSSKSSPSPSSVPTTPSSTDLTTLRADLTSTQRARLALESQNSALTTELTHLRTLSASQSKQLSTLKHTIEILERKVKDRAEEIRGKGRLVEEVQDEMVALNLQLNMCEQKAERLKGENEELTRRWIEKMEKEAKEMNERNANARGRSEG